MEYQVMNLRKLTETARALLADHKGLFAMDESTSTCNKRFADAGIRQTEENRRRYRELIIKTSGLNESISGVILYHETIRQSDEAGIPFIKIGRHVRYRLEDVISYEDGARRLNTSSALQVEIAE